MKLSALCLAACLAVSSTTIALAGDLMVSGTNVGVQLVGAYRATLTVAGPNDFYARATSPSGAVALALAAQGRLADGPYHWEARAASPQKKTARDPVTNQLVQVNESVVRYGTFVVRNGAIRLPAAGKRR